MAAVISGIRVPPCVDARGPTQQTKRKTPQQPPVYVNCEKMMSNQWVML